MVIKLIKQPQVSAIIVYCALNTYFPRLWLISGSVFYITVLMVGKYGHYFKVVITARRLFYWIFSQYLLNSNIVCFLTEETGGRVAAGL